MMKHTSSHIVHLAALSMAACSQSVTPAGDIPPPVERDSACGGEPLVARSIRVERPRQTSDGTPHVGGARHETRLFASREEAEAYTFYPTDEQPAVDWANEIVVYASSSHATGGYRLDFSNVTLNGDHVCVDQVLTTPGDKCALTMAFDDTFVALAVERPAAPVSENEFEVYKSTVTQDCE